MPEPTPYPLGPTFVPDPTARAPSGGFSPTADPVALIPPARSTYDASLQRARRERGDLPVALAPAELSAFTIATYAKGIFSAEVDEPGQGAARTKTVESAVELALPTRLVKTFVGAEGGVPFVGNKRAGQLNVGDNGPAFPALAQVEPPAPLRRRRGEVPAAALVDAPPGPPPALAPVADATASTLGGLVVSSGLRTHRDIVAVPILGSQGTRVGYRGVELPPITYGAPSPVLPAELVGGAVHGSIDSVLAGRGSDAPSNGARDNADRGAGGGVPGLAVTADP